MDRNLDRRVEALVPVSAPDLKARLREILATELSDDERAWEMSGDSTWHPVEVSEGVNAQLRFQELALARTRRRSDSDVEQVSL
jgi:polyphosphate kinase